MKAYKGFTEDMTCRGFHYKEGGEYETDKAEVCECGFHACLNPLDCFGYYGPGEKSVYHEVDLDGQIDTRSDGDTKVSATKIKIGARLSIAGIVKGAVDFVLGKVKPTTGNGAHAATTGDGAHAATTGNWAHAEVKGRNAIAAAFGAHSRARGGVGCWLVLAEYNYDGDIVNVRAVQVNGKRYKPDTWYCLQNGKVVKWEC